MTDRELLELAAKAAGIPLHELDDTYGDCGGIEKDGWNPLGDDGDALRLAVRLGITYGICADTGGLKVAWFNGGVHELVMPAHECRYSPQPREMEWLRRAIVRAAASIGKACQ